MVILNLPNHEEFGDDLERLLIVENIPFEKQRTNKIHVKNSTYMCSPETCRFAAQDFPISQYNSVGRNFGRLKIVIGISEFALPLVPLKIHDPSGHLKHSKSPRC